MEILSPGEQYDEIMYMLYKLGFRLKSTSLSSARDQILYKDTYVGFVNEYSFDTVLRYRISIYYTQEENPDMYKKLCLIGFTPNEDNDRVEYFIYGNNTKEDISS